MKSLFTLVACLLASSHIYAQCPSGLEQKALNDWLNSEEYKKSAAVRINSDLGDYNITEARSNAKHATLMLEYCGKCMSKENLAFWNNQLKSNYATLGIAPPKPVPYTPRRITSAHN